MGKKFIVSAFGKDRPGIVADVSQVLFENSCNLEDSRMANLSGEFSLLILFSSTNGGEDLEARLSEAYARLEKEKGISSYIRPVTTTPEGPVASTRIHYVTVEGLDHTGIVYRISRCLADNKVNIANLNSSIAHAPSSGASIYSMTIAVEIPDGLSTASLEAVLGDIADELHVDISIEQAQ